MNYKPQWSTSNEKGYIDTLVTGECLLCPCTTPKKRLRNYIQSAKHRDKSGTFGDVSARVVIRYAEDLLSD